MESHTERELKAWLLFFFLETNRPTKSDHYLMAIRKTLIDSKRAKGTPAIPFDSLKITFKQPETTTPRKSLTNLEYEKATWMGVIGHKPS